MFKFKKYKFRSVEDLVVDIVSWVVLFLVALLCLYPMVYTVSMSFSSDLAILMKSVRLFPKGFSLESYEMVFTNKRLLRSIFNSVIITVSGTALKVTCTLIYGYVFSRKEFVFKKFLSVFTLIPMVFGGGLIPFFMVVKSLGLYNTYWALILPAAVSLWDALIAKTFFRTNISDSLIDAARIDGCSQFQTFIRVVLPLSKTIIAILTLYAAVGFWNDYFSAMIFLSDTTKQPLQVILANIMSATSGLNQVSQLLDDSGSVVINQVNNQRMRYVLIVVSSLPIMVVYPFIQKYFVKGVMLGSIKE